MFNSYTLIARIFPTFISIIPFWLYLISRNFDFSNIKDITLSGDSLLSLLAVIPLYFLSNTFIRTISKIFEDCIFQKWKNMPSVVVLLDSNKEYSKEYRKWIKEKILNDFNLDVKNNIQKISEAMGQMRKVTRWDELLLQHNIEYWFTRNLFWASVVWFLLCIVAFVWDKYWDWNFGTSIFWIKIAGGLFLIYILFWYLLIRYYWYQYARQLISSYMTTQVN